MSRLGRPDELTYGGDACRWMWAANSDGGEREREKETGPIHKSKCARGSLLAVKTYKIDIPSAKLRTRDGEVLERVSSDEGEPSTKREIRNDGR